MGDVFEFIEHRRDRGQDTMVIVTGDPDRDHVRMVVNYIATTLPGDLHVLERTQLERAGSVFTAAETGDTLVVYLGSVKTLTPGTLEEIDRVNNAGQVKGLTWIFVSPDAPGTVIERYADIEVSPAVTGEVSRYNYDPYTGKTLKIPVDTIELQP